VRGEGLGVGEDEPGGVLVFVGGEEDGGRVVELADYGFSLECVLDERVGGRGEQLFVGTGWTYDAIFGFAFTAQVLFGVDD